MTIPKKLRRLEPGDPGHMAFLAINLLIDKVNEIIQYLADGAEGVTDNESA